MPCRNNAVLGTKKGVIAISSLSHFSSFSLWVVYWNKARTMFDFETLKHTDATIDRTNRGA